MTTPEDLKDEKPAFFSYENLRSIAILVIGILALRWSIVSPYHVPTPSMSPTIKVGDRLLASKLSYDVKIPFTNISLYKVADLKRGDIIVFQYPKDLKLDYVKRVIGLPGDRVQLVEDTLYINGEAQERIEHDHERSILESIVPTKEDMHLFREVLSGVEHWTMNEVDYKRPPGQSNHPSSGGEEVIPEGFVFVMGDNRDQSSDSRVWGKVPISYIRGKALFVLWSMYWPLRETLPTFRFDRFGQKLDAR